jgi:C-terminal processing protease CtpA/Prc
MKFEGAEVETLKIPRVMVFYISCAFFLLFAAGCANPYQINYLSTVQKWPGDVTQRLLKPEGPPKLVTTEDVKKDSRTLLESGYVLLGKANFRDKKLDESLALQQGKAVGAWMVLVAKKYVNTVTESVPFNQWAPDQTTITSETTQIQRDPEKPLETIQKQTVQTVQGELQTTYVPENVEYYDYSAAFWAKAKPPILGVLVQPLSDEQKKLYETNKGVSVFVVVNGSPAFNADILKGDLLMSLAGEEIIMPDQFFDIVNRHAGQAVELGLIRDGKSMTVQLRLNRD